MYFFMGDYFQKSDSLVCIFLWVLITSVVRAFFRDF